MKKMMNISLAAALAVGLTACGSSDGKGTSSATASPGGPVTGQTIKVMLSEEPSSGDAFNTALKAWEQESGNKVNIMVIPYDDQLTKFPSMAKNNDLPDLVATTRLHQLYPTEFSDLSKVVDTSKFEETALKIVGKDYNSTKITGLTLQYTITNMYYNKDAFQKAGLTAPAAGSPWTWDQLYENAATLQAKGGVKYGFASDVSRARYDILMYANGGSLVEKEGDKFAITVNSEKNVKTLESFIQANQKVMPKALWSGGTTDNPADYFQNGDVGIYLSGSWNYNKFASAIKNFQFGVMPTPKGSAGSAAIIGGAAVAVPEKAKNKAAADAFVKWLYEPKNFQTYLNNDKGLSALKDVVYQPTDDKAKQDYSVLQAEVKSIPDSFMVDESSAWRTYLDNEYRDSIKKAVAGEVNAKQALDDFAKALAKKSGWNIKGN